MTNLDFTIYSNNCINIKGLGNVSRIKGLTSKGQEQNISPVHQRVRVYDLRGNLQYADEQPFRDFELPAYVGGPVNWETNKELADQIKDWLS